MLAQKYSQEALTPLHHYLDEEWLQEAYRRIRKSGAPGVDGQTAVEYGKTLNESLPELLDRAKKGSYRAPPVKRAFIPKGSGREMRPIGIPTVEDKVLQRAVVMVLEPIYEHDFLDCSYGFRPNRDAHQALDALWEGITEMGGAWVLDVDIRRFFDTLDHSKLRELVRERVKDGVILRLLGKWLKAGVMQDGGVVYQKEGTPQGGVISPLLSNIYLHYVLDLWFEHTVKPRLRGRAKLVRYADDFVIAFAERSDAERVLEVLPKRLGRFGLELHPEKTRMLHFFPKRKGKPESKTFDFLGFTHYWGNSRRGRSVVKRRTAGSRLCRANTAVWDWCKKHRHDPVREQWQTLCAKLHGHNGYYGITGNSRQLLRYRYAVLCAWRYWLDRRGRPGSMPWERFVSLLRHYPLPPARVVHSIYRANPLT